MMKNSQQSITSYMKMEQLKQYQNIDGSMNSEEQEYPSNQELLDTQNSIPTNILNEPTYSKLFKEYIEYMESLSKEM